MAWTRIFFFICVPLLLSACASIPTQYLSLSVQGQPLPNQAVEPNHGVLLVDHVQMPASIDRLSLTRGQGKNGMQVSNHVRWIAPLGGMAQRVLTEDLRRRLPHLTVLLAGSRLPAHPQPLDLQVQVEEFLPCSNGKVILDADYFLLSPDQHPRYAGHFRYSEEVGSSALAAARGMSGAMAALAQEIVQHLPAEYRANAS